MKAYCKQGAVAPESLVDFHQARKDLRVEQSEITLETSKGAPN
jgi:hypothetical protein